MIHYWLLNKGYWKIKLEAGATSKPLKQEGFSQNVYLHRLSFSHVSNLFPLSEANYKHCYEMVDRVSVGFCKNILQVLAL